MWRFQNQVKTQCTDMEIDLNHGLGSTGVMVVRSYWPLVLYAELQIAKEVFVCQAVFLFKVPLITAF